MNRDRWQEILVPALMGILLLLFAAGTDADQTVPPDEAGKAAEPKATTPSAEDVLEQMRQVRKKRAATTPVSDEVVEGDEKATPPATGERVDYDRRVLGTAPGMPQPKLRREGEFIPLRRGRIVRAPGGGQVMFVFDAESQSAPEPPMFIMPCKTLEDMEKFVTERGDNIVFRVGGQVFVYRGANYLLPTIMKLAVDRGNLEK